MGTKSAESSQKTETSLEWKLKRRCGSAVGAEPGNFSRRLNLIRAKHQEKFPDVVAVEKLNVWRNQIKTKFLMDSS